MPADVNAVTPLSTSMAYLQRVFSMSPAGADGRFRSTAPAEEANASIHDAWPCGLQIHVFAAATAIRCKMIRGTSTRQMGMPRPGAVMNKYAHAARPPLAQAYVQSPDNAR